MMKKNINHQLIANIIIDCEPLEIISSMLGIKYSC